MFFAGKINIKALELCRIYRT